MMTKKKIYTTTKLSFLKQHNCIYIYLIIIITIYKCLKYKQTLLQLHQHVIINSRIERGRESFFFFFFVLLYTWRYMYMLLLYTYPRGQSYFDSAFSPRRITSRLAAEFAFLTKRLDESIHVYILHVHYSLVSFFFFPFF